MSPFISPRFSCEKYTYCARDLIGISHFPVTTTVEINLERCAHAGDSHEPLIHVCRKMNLALQSLGAINRDTKIPLGRVDVQTDVI